MISGMGLQNNPEDNRDGPYVKGRSIRFDFEAAYTGSYLFGVRTLSKANLNAASTGPHQVDVESPSH